MINKKKGKSGQAQKITKPNAMAMAYCKKLNVVIFTLVSKRVQVCKFNCSAQKKSFHTVGEYTLKHMPTNLAVGIHKATGRLLVFVSMQAIKGGTGPIQSHKKSKLEDEKCFISVIEFDQNCKLENDMYKSREIARINAFPQVQ